MMYEILCEQRLYVGIILILDFQSIKRFLSEFHNSCVVSVPTRHILVQSLMCGKSCPGLV
jgi:hypothetical protein